MKKLLVVGVIVLFLGVAVAPSIYANVGRNNELVEITTEICGLDGGNHTVQLTQEEVEEIEQLIDDIERRLDEVETREEVVEVFNEVIVELDKYGLLGELSVKQAQRLVYKEFLNFKEIKLIQKLYNVRQGNWKKDTNCFCLISGRTDNTYFLGMISPIVRLFRPTSVMNRILIGTIKEDWLGNILYYPSKGWIFTHGLKGIKSWNGTFWGNLSNVFSFYVDLHLFPLIFLFWIGIIMGGFRYCGIIGFSGIKILFEDAYYFYLGFALRVGITYETPSYPE